jgi:hypothetical protein
MILGLDIGGPHQFEIGFFPSIPNLISGRISKYKYKYRCNNAGLLLLLRHASKPLVSNFRLFGSA